MRYINSNVEVLSVEEIQMIHDSTMDLLETVGLKVPHEEWLDMAEESGAHVDRDNQIMRIPRKVMETIIEEKRQQAEGQKKKAESKILYGHISTQVQMVDYATKREDAGLWRTFTTE